MQRFYFLLIVALVTVSSAMATTTCLTTTYDNYLGTSCVTNNLEFSQFGFQAGGSLPPTAAQIGVTPLDVLGNEGFQFNPGFIVPPPGQSMDATLTFVVTGLNGTLIDDLSIFFNGDPGVGGATSFTETYCTGGFSTDCNQFAVQNPSGPLDKHIILNAPVSVLYITKDFGATSGATSTASISRVTNNYSNVPEPSQLGFLAAGLVGLFYARRKFNFSIR